VLVLLTLTVACANLGGLLLARGAARQREIGLRVALGAPALRLQAMVLRQSGMLAFIGGTTGALGALAIGRVAESLLFGLSAHDPRVLLVAALMLGVVIFIASYFPARRAAGTDPMVALRHQ
jgi:ABC-type antimicrobial peptide transport system permease subunit